MCLYLVSQAEYHASSQGLKIVGFYQGNERLQDGSLNFVGTKVANAIKGRFADAVVLLVRLSVPAHLSVRMDAKHLLCDARLTTKSWMDPIAH